MIKVDLITGFLGSGKTTFIKKYADYLIRQGNKIGILENDYGAVNVDTMLLQELEGDSCIIESVAGACDADCHKRRFKTKLIALGMSGLDRVLIEPSGIFDVDEFFDVLYEEPLDRWYEPGSVIAIVDSRLREGLSETSEYMLASQCANAGIVILSKTQTAEPEDVKNTEERINRVLRKFGCTRTISGEIMAKDWSTLSDGDFAAAAGSGYVSENYVKSFSEENGYSSFYYMNSEISAERLCAAAKRIFAECEGVFRIKGFVGNGEHWTEINADKNNIEMKPIGNGQEIIIVIGENMDKSTIDSYFM